LSSQEAPRKPAVTLSVPVKGRFLRALWSRAVRPYTRGVREVARSDGRGGNGEPDLGRAVTGRSARSPWLTVFCSGLLGPETGGRLAYGFVVASCAGPSKASGPRRSPGGGAEPRKPTGVSEWEIVHSHAALLPGDGPEDDLRLGLGKEALLAVSEHRAALAALGWLEAQGCLRERIFLFTGSRPLAKCHEEPFGLWRATRRRGEGALLKEVLASLSRFGDLSVKRWRPSDPEGVGETGGLAPEAAKEIFARARVAVLEEGRRERAKGVKLRKIGRGLYRANERYLVDAILGLCGCRDFEMRNCRKRKKAGGQLAPDAVWSGGAFDGPTARLPLVRCKHLIAAEEAEGQMLCRDQDPAPSRSASPTQLASEARSKPREGWARGGQNS
jgi:hypothetical protein